MGIWIIGRKATLQNGHSYMAEPFMASFDSALKISLASESASDAGSTWNISGM